MEKTWISDEHGNRCSVEYFGIEEAARKALASLIGCSGCSDCSDCSGCSGCSGCSDCSRCSGCSDCSRCSGCSDCSDCSRCSGCFGCFGCFGLENAAPVADEAKALTIPVIEDLHKKVYAAVSKPYALDMSTWHTCETTHCRAGWVVTLAGEQGKSLEARFDTLLAAMNIYDASCPGYEINPVRFFDTDEDAMADIKKMAGVA